MMARLGCVWLARAWGGVESGLGFFEEPPLVDYAGDGTSPHLAACHFADSLSLAGIKRAKHRTRYTIG